jgi:group I intron endonuclease
LLRAYEKHGIDKFKFQIICICFDEDCNKYETEYIKKFNTLAPHGYNIKEGGKSSKHHPDTIELMRARAKEWWAANRDGFENKLKGRHLSDSQKQRLRETSNNYWNNLSPEDRDKKRKEMSNRNRLPTRYKSEESRQRALNALITSRGSFRKAITQYTRDGVLIKEYKSITEAVEQTGVDRTTISKVCRGDPRYKTAGGFVWKFVETKESS